MLTPVFWDRHGDSSFQGPPAWRICAIGPLLEFLLALFWLGISLPQNQFICQPVLQTSILCPIGNLARDVFLVVLQGCGLCPPDESLFNRTGLGLSFDHLVFDLLPNSRHTHDSCRSYFLQVFYLIIWLQMVELFFGVCYWKFHSFAPMQCWSHFGAKLEKKSNSPEAKLVIAIMPLYKNSNRLIFHSPVCLWEHLYLRCRVLRPFLLRSRCRSCGPPHDSWAGRTWPPPSHTGDQRAQGKCKTCTSHCHGLSKHLYNSTSVCILLAWEFKI